MSNALLLLTCPTNSGVNVKTGFLSFTLYKFWIAAVRWVDSPVSKADDPIIEMNCRGVRMVFIIQNVDVKARITKALAVI